MIRHVYIRDIDKKRMKELYSLGRFSFQDIATQFRVSKTTARRIILNQGKFKSEPIDIEWESPLGVK